MPRVGPHRSNFFTDRLESACIVVGIVTWIGYIVYAQLGSRFSLDLHVYRAATEALWAGHDPLLLHFTQYRLSFTYPPFALFPLTAVAYGNVQLIEALWWFLNLFATVGVVYLGIRYSLLVSIRRAGVVAVAAAPILSLILEPLRSNTNYGQVNMFLLLLVVFDVTRTKKRGRGIGIGLAAAIKLTPLIYLAYFVISRDVRSAIRGVATFVFCDLVGLIVLPHESIHFWASQVFDPSRAGSVSGPRNQSLDGLFHRVPFSSNGIADAWIFFGCLVLVCGVALARRLASGGELVAAIVALGITSESG